MGSPCLARRRVFLASGERAACSALATVEHKVDGGENKEVEDVVRAAAASFFACAQM